MRELPKRKPNRLGDYDYCQNGAYFITICAKNHEEVFATIVADDGGRAGIRIAENDGRQVAAPTVPRVVLSDIGQTIDISIKNISQTYPFAFVDAYVIMPNHLHMVLVIENDGRQVAAPTTSLQTIVGHLKRFVSMQCGYSVWQKSFHDHIIRNEEDYFRIAEYIENNPLRWADDCYYDP